MKIDFLPVNDNHNGWLRILPALAPARTVVSNQTFGHVVIGAGYTGLAAARRLGELLPDARIALVDAGRIGNNAAGRCSGFAIDQAHNIRAKSFADEIDNEKTQLRLNRAGQDALREAIQDNNIACDWQEVGKIHGAGTARGETLLAEFAGNLDLLGESYRHLGAAEMKDITGIDFYRTGLFTPGTMQMQPAALVRGLAGTLPGNVEVFENSPVTEVRYGKPHALVTPGGTLTTASIVLANNGFGTAFGFYTKHVIPLPTFASMTRELTGEELARLGGEPAWGIIPADPFGSTVRRLVERRILVRNIYAFSPGHNPTEAQRMWARKHHQRAFHNRFPMLEGVEFEYSWGGSLCLSDNGKPIFGKLDHGVFAALCHNGVGISRGTVCGKLIAEQVSGHDSALLQIMAKTGRPNKTLPTWLMRIGAPISLAHRRRKAGLEL